MNKSAAYMCEGPLLKKIIFYALPVVLTGLLQLLFNAADLIIVGRFAGSLCLGAVGATGSIINLIVNLFIGLSVGAGVLVAQGVGAGSYENVHKTVHTAIPAAIIGGAGLTVIGVGGARLFLELMGTQSDVIDMSVTYMRIYFCGMIFSMVYNFGASILRAVGDIRSPLLFLSAAGILNVLLNIVFVVGFKIDVAGVALATIISQAVSAALIVFALSRRDDACRLFFKEIKISKEHFAGMVRIGLPAGIQGSLFSISNVLIQSSINSFGSVAMSGNAAAGNIEGFVYVSMNAFQQTATNFAGQNYGAKLYKRIDRIVIICLISVTFVGLTLGNLCVLFSRKLLGIYITDSLEAIEIGVLRMSFIAAPYFLDGIMEVMTGTLRGMGRSVMPMAVTIAGVCVFRIVWIATVFAIPEYHTLKVLFISYPISWSVTFAVELIAYIVIMRKIKKQNTAISAA
ncbi:MAG: MATE family efflux transporter [Oscillospiraceae bacterium]|nr:MATE family efflux transporter [Oscillospiraceae bacterium]